MPISVSTLSSTTWRMSGPKPIALSFSSYWCASLTPKWVSAYDRNRGSLVGVLRIGVSAVDGMIKSWERDGVVAGPNGVWVIEATLDSICERSLDAPPELEDEAETELEWPCLAIDDFRFVGSKVWVSGGWETDAVPSYFRRKWVKKMDYKILWLTIAQAHSFTPVTPTYWVGTGQASAGLIRPKTHFGGLQWIKMIIPKTFSKIFWVL
jgi:hypothetical protein